MTSDDRKRELRAEIRAIEQQKLLDSFPVDIEFLKSRDIDSANVIPWLKEHGGFCDCEVIYNVYDDVGDLVG